MARLIEWALPVGQYGAWPVRELSKEVRQRRNPEAQLRRTSGAATPVVLPGAGNPSDGGAGGAPGRKEEKGNSSGHQRTIRSNGRKAGVTVLPQVEARLVYKPYRREKGWLSAFNRLGQ